MLRSSSTGESIYDPKTEKTAHKQIQETKKCKEKQSSTASDLEQEEYMMTNNRTLRELATPGLT